MALPNTYRSRILGSYYGMLVGDALGAPYEFKKRDSYAISADYVKVQHFGGKLPLGAWTDDSSMALCLLESLLQKGGEWDAVDCVERWIRWWRHGHLSVIDTNFDIGIATQGALRHHEAYLARTGKMPEILSYNPQESKSGNGSIMRLAPAPLLSLHRTPADVATFARATSIPTHASPLCTDACALLALYIYHLVRSPLPTPAERRAAVLDPSFVLSEDSTSVAFVERVQSIREGHGWRGLKREQISTSGFVLHTLCAALWAFDTYGRYEEGLMALLSMGNDVDTVCAVYGQIAGACYGVEAIPERWKEGLAKKEMLDGYANRMVTLAEVKLAEQ